MKRTNKRTITRRQNGYPVYRRVWEDVDGKLYVKDEGKWWCINGTAMMDYITEA